MHQQRYTVFPPVTLPSTSSGPASEVRDHGIAPASEQRVRFHAGMTVACADGVLGYVERSLPTWQPHHPTHLVVRTGEQAQHAVIVPVHWAADVSTGAAACAQAPRGAPCAVPNILTMDPTFFSGVQTRNKR